MSGKKWERRRRKSAVPAPAVVPARAGGDGLDALGRVVRESGDLVGLEAAAMVERLLAEGGGSRADRARVGALRAACWGFFLLYAKDASAAWFVHRDSESGEAWRFDLSVTGALALLCGEHRGERSVLAEIALAPCAGGPVVRWRASDEEIARYPDPGFLPKPEPTPERVAEPEPERARPVAGPLEFADEDWVNAPLIAARCGRSTFAVHQWAKASGFPEPRDVEVRAGKRFRAWAWGEVAAWLWANGKVRAGSPLARARERHDAPWLEEQRHGDEEGGLAR